MLEVLSYFLQNVAYRGLLPEQPERLLFRRPVHRRLLPFRDGPSLFQGEGGDIFAR